jgi:pyridoxal phosphate enzyme (YggS family)
MMSNLIEHQTNMNSIENRHHQLVNRLRSAEVRFGRTLGSVCLVAVSKTRCPEAIRAIAALRQKDFGENQLQEALGKIEILSDLDCTWHFIGSIQTNKCRDIAAHFDWVHSVDRLKIARRLSDLRPATAVPLNIFLQVNLQGEATKSGIAPGGLTSLASAVHELPNLQLRGLMAIPEPEPSFERQQKVFSELRELQNGLNQALDLTLDCLSMGMTDDFEAAIAEGATHVRVGTAIFGPRKPHA